MFVQKNYFERETDFLGDLKIRQQIENTFQISSLIVNYEYERALQLIQYFRKEFQLNQLGLDYELQLMEAFCYFQLKNIENTKEICLAVYNQLQKQEQQLLQKSQASMHEESKSRSNLILELKRSFSVRFYTFVISICIQGQNIGIQPAEVLDRLIVILKMDKCIYLPQVLGTLTGCKCFKEVKKLKSLNGEDNKKKAIKLQILAVWKYLINDNDECIKFKKEALKIWKNQNALKEKQKCQQELKQLLDSKNGGKFIKKLARINFFVCKLRALEKQANEYPKQMNIKWTFPILIKSIRPQLHQEKGERNLQTSSLVKSSVKKGQLNQIINKCEHFYQNYKKQIHNEATGLIFNSKFIDERMKEVRVKIGKFLKKTKRYVFMTTFPHIKQCAQARIKKIGIVKTNK